MFGDFAAVVVDHTDAASYQPSDYSGVTLADLVEIKRALSVVPSTLQVFAVLGRVSNELAGRGNDKVGAAARKEL